MMTRSAPESATQAAGLVYLLDAAGRTIASLEQRIEGLEAALSAERAEREALTAALAGLRADTADVPPSGPTSGEHVDHDHRPHGETA